MQTESAAPAAKDTGALASEESKTLNQSLSDNPALKEAAEALKDAKSSVTDDDGGEKKAQEATAEKASVDKKLEEVRDEKKEEDRFSRRFAELTKREKELVKRRQEISEIEKKYADYEKKLKDAEDDPLAFLEANNLSYDKLTEHILSGTKKDPAVKKLELELKAEKELRQKRDEEARKLAEEKALSDFKTERVSKIKEAGEKYQLVNALGDYELVHQVTQEHFDATKNENGVGEILSFEKAAEMVEDYLDKQIAKLKDVPKLKKLLGILKESEPVKDEANAEEASKQSATLSNDMALNAAEPSNGFLSDEESLKRAARILKWD
jgi:hypothetical protein